MNSYFFEIIDRLIDDLPDHLKDPNNPLEIDLVLDGGAFNGSFLTGALFFLKEMEKRNFIKIKRISGCSIGSCVGFLYLIDCLDLNITLYNDVIQHFKKNYNLEIYKNLKFLLAGRIPKDVCNIVNKKLYITYNDIQKGKKRVKCKYKNEDEIFDTIIRSSFFPYLIDGNFTHKNKYTDGFNPYFFKHNPNRKILFLDLSGLDKLIYIFNIKNEKTNFFRVLSGLLDIHVFFTKQKETSMCSYVNEWTILNNMRFGIRLILEKIICVIVYLIALIKKYLDSNMLNNISYKIANRIVYDIFIIMLEKYCL